MIQLPFSDRAEAGRLLAAELASRELPENVMVLALPRGGVPVGWEVAKALRAPLCARHLTSSWCVSWAFPGNRSSQWARSQADPYKFPIRS